MCFSAEASFIGAAALGIIGTATLKMPLKKQNLLWAAIPCFFGLQQFFEGVVWLDLRGSIPHSAFTVLAKDLYLFFALAFWVIWIPLAFLVAEPDPMRKNFMKLILFLGFITATINLNLYNILEITPSVNKHSINYLSEAVIYKRAFYLAIVATPPFISSLRYMKVFSLLIIISAIIAEYFYTKTFTSVWCFLGSFISACLFLISRANVPAANAQPINLAQPINKKSIHK